MKNYLEQVYVTLSKQLRLAMLNKNCDQAKQAVKGISMTDMLQQHSAGLPYTYFAVPLCMILS